jgi:hypothetical protein
VQWFLGFTNFYRRFIQDFSHHVRPLFDLTGKNAPWTWGEAQQTAFDELKRAVTSQLVLMFADDARPFRIKADSSDFATGTVLSQQSAADEKWHPVASLSKGLNAVERNYEIHDKEMLAIIRALEEWRHFLEGARLKFEVWTDNKNLEYFQTAQKLNWRQAQWSLYIGEYCKTCDLCLRTKAQKRPPMGELKPLPIPEGRWDVASVDFIVELPESQGHDTIMVVVDSVRKQAHFIETHTKVTALGAAWLYLQDVWKLHGLPWTMISGCGPQFVAQFTRELYHLLGIKLAASTAYHPQTNRQTEHVNQELKQYLRVFVSERQDNWTELLPFAEFQYNNHVQASTQHSPFLLNTGRRVTHVWDSNPMKHHLTWRLSMSSGTGWHQPWKRQNWHWQRQKTTWHSTTTAAALRHWCTRSETWCTWTPETSTPPGHLRNLHTTILDPTRLKNVLEPMPTTSNSLLLCPAYTQSSMSSSCFQLCETQSQADDLPRSQNQNSLMERSTTRLRKFLTANSSGTNCNTLLLGKAMVMKRIPGQMQRMSMPKN